MTTFIERLQLAAEYAGVAFSQAPIANSLGLERQTVNYWMRHGGEPRGPVYFLISDKWGVDARWLATGEGQMVPPPGPGLKAEELELLKGYRQASSPHRASLRVMAKSLSKALLAAFLLFPFLPAEEGRAAIYHNAFVQESSCAKSLNGLHIFAFLQFFAKLFRFIRISDAALRNFATLG